MFNPILSKHDIPRFNLFNPRPSGEPGIAIVLFRDNGPSMALKAGHSFTAADLAWGSYKGYYRVDVAEHTFGFQARIPCEKDAFHFEANVDCTYQVSSPAIVVDKQIKDPETVLKSYILEKMREISRKYTTQQSEPAEREINVLFRNGFTISGLVAHKTVADLSLDEATKAHVRQLQDIDNQRVRQAAQHDVDMMQEQFNLERQRIRMEFYAPLIQQGQWQLLALHLSNNPNDVSTIIETVQRQRRSEVELQLQALKAFIDGDVIEGFQIEDDAKAILKRLVDNLGISSNKLLSGATDSSANLPEKKTRRRKKD